MKYFIQAFLVRKFSKCFSPFYYDFWHYYNWSTWYSCSF